MKRGLIIDLFAGGGGASTGIEAATGETVDSAINHSATALAVHCANHPATTHLTADIWEVKPREVTRGRPVDLLWASPDCTHFSVAKGGKPREQGIRSLAWAVVEWARAVRPRIICLENVGEFRTWGPLNADGKPNKARMGETFDRWRGALELLGYQVDFRVLDASHYGAPTKRRRLFLVARCDGQPIRWPEPTHGPGRLPLHTAAECIDWRLPCPSIFDRARPLAEATLRRVALGIERYALDTTTPHVMRLGGGLAVPALVQTGYGERPGQAPRVLDLDAPLGVVVADGQKHALVAAFVAKHYTGEVGQSLDRPLGTVTAIDHHSLVTAELGTDAAKHYQRVRHLLGREAVVRVGSMRLPVVDVGLRMLAPQELLRAQFGRFAATYDLTAAKTVREQVRLVGNSVCPEVAEAVVAANWPRVGVRRAA